MIYLCGGKMKKDVILKEIIDNNTVQTSSKNVLDDVINEDILNKKYDFNIEIDGGRRYNQENSGMCWIYSGFNMIENNICSNLNINLQNLSFSVSFLAFYDYLEKANGAYQIIIDNNFNDITEVYKNQVIKNCLKAYGNFHQFRYLVNKYGLVPETIMPDAYLNLNPGDFRWLFNNKILNDCLTLFSCKKRNNINDLYLIKKKMLKENYAILCKALGKPLDNFKYKYYDVNNNLVSLDMTPLEFKQSFLSLKLDDYVVIDSLSRYNRENHKKYFYDDLKNIYSGLNIDFLSVTKKELKELIIKQLNEGIPVYCSSDVRRMRNLPNNIIDLNIYDLKKLGIKLLNSSDVANFDMISYYHVVCIKGVKIENKNIVRWKIEDSYGNGYNNGYIYISDEAFDYFVFGALINKKYLNDEFLKLFNLSAKKDTVY